MPTLTSRVFLGNGVAGNWYRWGSAPTDDSQPVPVRLESARLAPAGMGGECVFTALYPTLTYTADVTVRFIPIVDDVRFDGQPGNGPNAVVVVALVAPADGRRVRYRKELGLSQPYLRGGVDQGRFALRGVWFQLRVEVVAAIGLDALGGPGELIVDGVEIEFAEVGVTQDAVAAPAYP